MPRPFHFYITFNPFINKLPPGRTQAHEFQELLEKNISEDGKNGHAWWGKMIAQERSPNKKTQELRKIISENASHDWSTHIFITDYAHLWVGKVTDIQESLSAQEIEKSCLPFYLDKKVEAWFKIVDFTLLTFTPEDTSHKLYQLYIDNKFCDLKISGLSPFTSLIRLPAIVQDNSQEQYFDILAEGEKLVTKSHLGPGGQTRRLVQQCLKNFLLPEEMYSLLPFAVKTEIEMAESNYFEHEGEDALQNAFTLIKALEMLCNDLVIGTLRREGHGENFFVDASCMPAKIYLRKEQEHFVSLEHWQKTFGIRQVLILVERCLSRKYPAFISAFSKREDFIQYLNGPFRKFVESNELLEYRGLMAHQGSSKVPMESARAIRRVLLGIGSEGIIPRLMKLFHKKVLAQLFVIKNSSSQKDERKAS